MLRKARNDILSNKKAAGTEVTAANCVLLIKLSVQGLLFFALASKGNHPCNHDENGVGIPVRVGGQDGDGNTRKENPAKPTKKAEAENSSREEHGETREECAADEEENSVDHPEIHFYRFLSCALGAKVQFVLSSGSS